MEYPFNDEIFDNDCDEIFQNNQLENDSLWCNGLIDISEYDNQFFHDDTNFEEVLASNSNCTQPHNIGQFPFEIDDDHNPVLDLEMSPLHLKPEGPFKPYSSVAHKPNTRSPSKPVTVHSLKDKSELFFIENLTQPKQTNLVIESHNAKDDFINHADDLEAAPMRYVFHKAGDNGSSSHSNGSSGNSNSDSNQHHNYHDNHGGGNSSSNGNSGNKKNVFYVNQYSAANRRHKTPTIFLTKRNSIGSARKPMSRISRQDSAPIYSIYQDTGARNQSDRMKYSLSPSTSSPDSAMDCSLSGNTFQQNFNDDYPLYTKHSDAPNKFYEMKYKVEKSSRDGLFSSKISNASRLFQSPIPQTGLLILTEEEKRTLLLENYSIPTRLPLTKQEERNLKKVRRKIKNKISAQESRRKKKEYMEALEKKVEIYAHENNDLKKRLENQESLNKSLLGQLRHLQQMLGRAGSNTASTCLMVFLLCFSLILVGMPDRLQTLRPPQSVLVVSNIHKVGYGSIGNHHGTQMTAMQRYFPQDINGLVENSHDHTLSLSKNESGFVKTKNKGNEPVDSIFTVNNALITNQRKGILLENTKEENEDCVQYGPRYLWWFLHSTNLSPNIEKAVLAQSVTNEVPPTLIEDNDDSILTTMTEISMDDAIVPRNRSQLNADKLRPSNETHDQFQLSFFGIST